MAKKRKHTSQGPSGPREYNSKDGKLGPIRTYEDVADSEDDFHIQRDKILLEDGPDTKRRRREQEDDALLAPSDEEVLGYDESSSDEDNEDNEDDRAPAKRRAADADSGNEDEEEEADEISEWGTSRKDLYGADDIETEEQALEQEAEAKRIQQKKLQKMSEADFGFDENEWKDAAKEDEDGDVITEVLKDVEITDDMRAEERLRLLQTRYPEFEFLANEFIQLQPLLSELRLEAKTGPVASMAVIKSRALAAYIGALTMYFAVLTSTSKDGNAADMALNPMELRDHGVMNSLLECRELWAKVKNLEGPSATEVEDEETAPIPETLYTHGDLDVESTTNGQPKKSRKQLAREAAAAESAKARKERISAAEADLDELSTLLPKRNKKITRTAQSATPAADDNDSDFGEEETLSTRALAEKDKKKKSLRFYTSQIAQKANRRADAGRDAGGDADLPYRERLRDRQARLNVEAERRGKKLDEYGRGTALGDDSGDDAGAEADAATAAAVRDDEDEYYDMVAGASSKRKSDKASKYAAIAEAKAAGAIVRVVDGEVGEDGKRAIGYVIQKNKGLAPKRKKEVRNPRVKKRKKYEEKMKKLSSTRAVFKGGEGRGGYGGELTGIKSGLVKSLKL